ncbi:MAG: hypothetical protein JO040_03435 [Gemmatimonadetes bacterium]|nr:hypothetical protein [Gemmatimonadota bacterium]
MQHLTLEAIARLVDEPPHAEEALHLEGCADCRMELEEMRGQTAALAGLADPEPSPFAWPALEARLREEGVIRPQETAKVRPRHSPVLRMAASVAVLVLGGTVGRELWRGGTVNRMDPERIPSRAAGSPVAAPALRTVPAVTVGAPPVQTAARADPPAGGEPSAEAEAPKRTLRSAAHSAPRRSGASATAAQLRAAQADYVSALSEYASVADDERADPVVRLAALEGLVRATRTALERAPEDPVINGYYLAAMGKRDATLQRMARSSEETWY